LHGGLGMGGDVEQVLPRGQRHAAPSSGRLY
jgi:hypothetical protein